jgi:16S rRNA (adenine(1408)-N(1))-methyltransferase
VEALPPELTGVADHITVVLPWGSLLAAVARPIVPILGSVRALCGRDARLTVVLGVDPSRDQAEACRLDLPILDAPYFEHELARGYAAAGFAVRSVHPLAAEELARWPSSWAKRLAFGQPRPIFQIEARCAP